jgi:hypothetical protein
MGNASADVTDAGQHFGPEKPDSLHGVTREADIDHSDSRRLMEVSNLSHKRIRTPTEAQLAQTQADLALRRSRQGGTASLH